MNTEVPAPPAEAVPPAARVPRLMAEAQVLEIGLLSMTPSQLSSTPLQVSVVAVPSVALQVVPVPEQMVVPVRAQAPPPTEQEPPIVWHTPEQLG
jgi:hypothetical protein